MESLEPRHLLAANPIISEIVADNDGSLVDGDEIPNDWIEIYNDGDEAVDLNGWHLTDDPEDLNKWRFPTKDLEAGRYLVVFASGHVGGDYVDPEGNLHTNFRLAAGGEYLALVRPDSTVASELSPEFPQQRTGLSYGPSMTTATDPVIGAGAIARTLVPSANIGDDWSGGTEPFDDSQWIDGVGNSTGVGYSIAQENTPGLVAEWTFESSDGVPVSDSQLAVGTVDETGGHVKEPLTGTASGDSATADPSGLAYTTDTPSGIGSSHALLFPAPENAQNHVEIPIDVDAGLSTMTIGDFRIEAWFKTTDTRRNVLTGSYVGAPTSLNLELHTRNRGRLYVQGPSATTDLNLTLPTNSRDGNWHHLAGVRNGTNVELYYDGVLVGSQVDVAGDFVIDKEAVFIGRDDRMTSVIFNGSIDDVHFYNSADTTKLVAAYDFETTGGVAVADGQDATGQIDDTSGTELPQHGDGSSVGGGTSGINYTSDIPAELADSSFALEFDEGNRNVESVNLGMPAAVANLTQGDFTLQTWFSSTDAGRSILMGSYTGPDNALNLELHTGNRLRVYVQNAGGGTTDLNVSVDPVGNSRDGQWHFATAVRRGNSVELYFDGVLVGQTADSAGSFVQTARNFYFGRDSRTGETRFDGRLDNVRFWNVALEVDQIIDMANGAMPGDVTGGAFDKLIGTNVDVAMRGQNTSALVRVPFDVDDPNRLSLLKLKMKYDDGFVAFINGQEVAKANAPDQTSWNSSAMANRDTVDSNQYEEFTIGGPGRLLTKGTNILAIQGLNADLNDDNFLILPELIGLSTTVDRKAYRYFPRPTPGEANSDGTIGFVSDTEFSVDRGFFDASDLAADGVLESGIVISTDTPGATIRYTVDGSWPSAEHGIVYNGPIQISTTTTLRAAAFVEGYLTSNIDTQTYLFLDDVIRQPRNPGANDPGDPTYPLRFPRSHQAGVAADYQMDPGIVQDPLYADTIKDDLMSIPTMSLVMDMDDIFNQPDGIWSNSQQSGDAWERLTSVEYFDPGDPDREFQLNSAIRIQGRASRVPASSIKHSFRLIFKEEFGPEGQKLPTGGPTKLDFPLFENSDVDRFDNIILRGGYNYSYLHGANDQNIRAQYIRERFMRESQLATGQLSASGSYVHLYVNGLYFGLYAPQERPDASFMAQHLGGDKDDYDVISAGQVRNGSADAWNELLTRAGEDLSVQENYDAVLAMLDVENLIDYMIVHIWGGTTDWPAPGGQLRNWIVGRKREAGAGFKFFVWDAEYSIQATNDNRVNVGDANTPAFLYRRLRANPEFRLLFADQVQEHFFNDGALTPENNIARYASLADEIDRAIVGESARWGDTRGDGCNPCRRDPLWVNERDWVLNTYMPGRTDTVLNQFRSRQLYPSTEAPDLNQHGGNVRSGFELMIGSASTDTFFETALVAPESPAEILIPSDDQLGISWTDTAFVPSDDWLDGTTGVGFDTGADYDPFINTDVETRMRSQQTSAYLRIPFQHDVNDQFDILRLRMRYDDGFVAYINGVEVARSTTVPGGIPSFDTTPSSHEANSVDIFDIELRDFGPNLLIQGTNLLAIHGLNRSKSNSDFLIQPELIGSIRDNSPGPRPIWYTTDGSDPRLSGGEINPRAIQYAGPFVLTENTNLKARVFANEEWSAETTASFVVDTQPLRITEINYNPAEPTAVEQLSIPGVDVDDFEFIEIQNIHKHNPIQLKGFGFTNGVDFEFPNVSLPPGEYAVVVEDITAFQERFGTEIQVLGQWSGGLSNGGERVTLADAVGNVVLDFEFNDADPWANRADGQGASLELVDPVNTPVSQYGKPDRWRGSIDFGGSPGRAGTEPIGVVINEVLANSTAPSTDSIELYNSTQSAIDISGWFLSDSSGNFLKYRIPDGTLLGAREYVVFDENDFNPQPPNQRPNDFALSGTQGDDVWLVIPDGGGRIRSFVDDVHFGASVVGESHGRVPSGIGRFAPLVENSFGTTNTAARVGPIVISEINYAPGLPSPAALAVGQLPMRIWSSSKSTIPRTQTSI